MIAEAVLAAFAGGLVFYRVQKVYGRAYERRTERLQETRDAFYVAAHTTLKNELLDERTLSLVRSLSEHVAAGDRGSMYFRIGLTMLRSDLPKMRKEIRSATALALHREVALLTRMAVRAVAERQILWKFPVLWVFQRVRLRSGLSSAQELALGQALDDCLMRAV